MCRRWLLTSLHMHSKMYWRDRNLCINAYNGAGWWAEIDGTPVEIDREQTGIFWAPPAVLQAGSRRQRSGLGNLWPPV